MTTHRFFAASADVYESVRFALDAAWGLPEPLTQTAIPPASEQATDGQGRCLLAVRLEWMDWEPIPTLLPQMIAAGQIEEITEAEYWAALQQPDLP